MLDEQVENVALEKFLQYRDVILHVERQTVEVSLRIEGAVCGEPMQVGVNIHLVPEELRLDDETDRDVVAPETGTIELLRDIGSGTTEPGEHFRVAMEVLAEHLGHDEDKLPVVDRFNDLFFDEAAENLRPLLLAR